MWINWTEGTLVRSKGIFYMIKSYKYRKTVLQSISKVKATHEHYMAIDSFCFISHFFRIYCCCHWSKTWNINFSCRNQDRLQLILSLSNQRSRSRIVFILQSWVASILLINVNVKNKKQKTIVKLRWTSHGGP